jgi:hypothetical protein
MRVDVEDADYPPLSADPVEILDLAGLKGSLRRVDFLLPLVPQFVGGHSAVVDAHAEEEHHSDSRAIADSRTNERGPEQQR